MVDKSEYIQGKFPDYSPNSSGKIHAHCPFHDDRRPSFSIDLNEGLFVCGSSSCGVRGTFPLFYKLMEGIVSWSEVFERLKEVSTDFDLFDFLNGKTDDSPKSMVNEFPASESLEVLNNIQFLNERGISPETVQKYGLCYGKFGEYSGVTINQSIVAPVWDIGGEYRTFQLRCLNPGSFMRWVNPAGSPIQELLYGGWAVQSGHLLWIVEGASDVWKLDSLGIQAVGLNTKEATASQLNRIMTLCRLYRIRPLVCLDGDAQVAAEKLFAEIRALGLYPRMITLKDGEDPGGLTLERLEELKEEYAF